MHHPSFARSVTLEFNQSLKTQLFRHHFGTFSERKSPLKKLRFELAG
jgi:hypothetical protein